MNESFDRWWKQFPISKGGREGGREGGKSGLYGPSYCFLSFVDLSIRFLTGMAWKSELVSNIGELIRSDLAAQCAFRFVNVVFTVPLADVSLFQLPFPTVNLDFVSISHCPTSIFWFLSFFFLFFFFRFLLLLSAPSMRMFLSFFSRSPGSVLFLLKWNRRTGKALWSQDNRFRNSGQPWPHPVEFTSIVKP